MTMLQCYSVTVMMMMMRMLMVMMISDAWWRCWYQQNDGDDDDGDDDDDDADAVVDQTNASSNMVYLLFYGRSRANRLCAVWPDQVELYTWHRAVMDRQAWLVGLRVFNQVSSWDIKPIQPASLHGFQQNWAEKRAERPNGVILTATFGTRLV